MKAIVNRLYEFDPDEPEVIVTLENGYKERFWYRDYLIKNILIEQRNYI